MPDLTYVRAHSLSQAIAFLNEPGVRSRPLAGGTDLLIQIRDGAFPYDRVIDIGQVPELKGIDVGEETITLGAGVTFTEILEHPSLGTRLPLLTQACREIAGVQIRNRATLGGNVINAAACADTLVVLICLEANAIIALPDGSETSRPVAQLVTGPGHTQLPAGALVRAFTFTAPPDPTRTVYLRVGRRRAMVIARLSLAALAALDRHGKVTELRLVPGAAFSPIRRVVEVERLLLGQTPTAALFERAGAKMEDALRTAGGRWSAAYKLPVLAALTVQALQDVLR